MDFVSARPDHADAAGHRPRLAVATGEQVDAIYRESHAMWGAGLRLGDYRGLWDDLGRTAWARRHARFLVWCDEDGRVLSSLKEYRPLLRLGERVERATVVGAVFTPVARRGQGHATAMLHAVLELGCDRGDHAAVLFSDIGTDYYASLGFRALPAEEQSGRLRALTAGELPDWRLQPVRAEDLPAVREAHDAFCAARPLAFVRDDEHWEFLQVRTRRFFERLADPYLRPRFDVAWRGGAFAGYLASVEGRGEWNVREVGAPGGDPELMASVVRLGAEAAVRRGLSSFYGWLPPEVASWLGSLRLRSRARNRALPMVLPFGSRAMLRSLRSASAAYIPFQDQF